MSVLSLFRLFLFLMPGSQHVPNDEYDEIVRKDSEEVEDASIIEASKSVDLKDSPEGIAIPS